MSLAGKPAAFNRAAMASAAVVTLPAGVSVVLISMSSLKISRARASFGPDCAPRTLTIKTAITHEYFMAQIIGDRVPDHEKHEIHENHEKIMLFRVFRERVSCLSWPRRGSL